MSENTINTAVLGELPGTMLGIVRDKALDAGILSQLSPEKPTIFGPVKGATFSGVPRASIVGESEQKPAAQKPTITPWRAEPLKVVTQVRTSDEFMWADSDYRLGVMSDLIAPALGSSIGRAVDLIAFHGINPSAGTVSSKVTKCLSQATSTVTSAGAPTRELNEAVGLLAGTGIAMPNGIAMDAAYNYSLATEVYPTGHSLVGQPMYPQMGFNGIDNWRGLKVGQSSTVSGAPEISAPSNIKAIVGDWSEVTWGFQRNFPMELVEYGDQAGDALGRITTAVLPVVEDGFAKIAPSVGGLVSAFQPLVNAIGRVVELITPVLIPAFKFLAGIIMDSLKGAIDGVTLVIRGLTDVFNGIVDFVTNVFAGNWTAAWEGIKTAAWGAIPAIAGGMWTWLNVSILGTIRGGMLKALNFFTGGWASIKGLFSTTLNWLKGIVGGTWSAIRSNTGAVWNGIKSMISGVWNGIKRKARVRPGLRRPRAPQRSWRATT